MSKDIYKIVLIGDGGVGKTCIRNQFIHNRFSNKYKTTIGADFITKELEKNGSKVTLQIWDTAGQERFQSLGIAFYRGADACIMVYDVNNRTTFESLNKWRNEFLKYYEDSDARNFPFVLLGNKIDLDEKEVFKNQVDSWINMYKTENMVYPWFETSAKLGINVEKAFQAAVDLIMIKTEEQEIQALNHSHLEFSESSQHDFNRYEKTSSMYSQPIMFLTPAQIKLREFTEISSIEQQKSCCYN